LTPASMKSEMAAKKGASGPVVVGKAYGESSRPSSAVGSLLFALRNRPKMANLSYKLLVLTTSDHNMA
jgi:hypothetical protein